MSTFKSAPTPNANGVMKAMIATPVLQPRSFRIMKKFAMHGTNSVTVTSATVTWTSMLQVIVPERMNGSKWRKSPAAA